MAATPPRGRSLQEPQTPPPPLLHAGAPAEMERGRKPSGGGFLSFLKSRSDSKSRDPAAGRPGVSSRPAVPSWSARSASTRPTSDAVPTAAAFCSNNPASLDNKTLLSKDRRVNLDHRASRLASSNISSSSSFKAKPLDNGRGNHKANSGQQPQGGFASRPAASPPGSSPAGSLASSFQDSRGPLGPQPAQWAGQKLRLPTEPTAKWANSTPETAPATVPATVPRSSFSSSSSSSHSSHNQIKHLAQQQSPPLGGPATAPVPTPSRHPRKRSPSAGTPQVSSPVSQISQSANLSPVDQVRQQERLCGRSRTDSSSAATTKPGPWRAEPGTSSISCRQYTRIYRAGILLEASTFAVSQT